MLLAVASNVPTVHTTGINIDGSLTTAVLVVALLTPLFGLMLFVLRSFIGSAIELALKPVWNQLDQYGKAIARLEGIEQGKQFMQEQQKQIDKVG